MRSAAPTAVWNGLAMAASAPPSGQVIVVGVDGSEHADAALGWALDEARLRGATLRLVHAWQYLPVVAEPMAAIPSTPAGELEAAGRQTALEALERVAGTDPGVAVETVVVEGAAGAALLDASEGATLLVVGSRGRGGFTGLLLGSVSQQVTHNATCPVVVLPKGVAG
jgi:nucleotide-binding universal stress UspA family protein